MPRIDADLKLDFKDVLLRPKRSSLKSRAEVGAVRKSQWGWDFFYRVAPGKWVEGGWHGVTLPALVFEAGALHPCSPDPAPAGT